jgi:hypothetical protein
MKSENTIRLTAVILCGAMLIAGLIHPPMLTLESIALSVIAAYLAGIYAELKRANDLRSATNAGTGTEAPAQQNNPADTFGATK